MTFALDGSLERKTRFLRRHRQHAARSTMSGRPDPKVRPMLQANNRSLSVALVPQPKELPPPAFDKEALQKIFGEIITRDPYRAFEFIYNDRGIQLNNGPEDSVEIRPALIQVQAKMDDVDALTAGAAEDKAMRILKIIAERLHIPGYLQCAIQIQADVEVGDSADDGKAFVEQKLLSDPELADVLGEGYFGAGVRFRRLKEVPEAGEDSLSIEPYVDPPKRVLVNHQVTRQAVAGPIMLSQVSDWIGDAFGFVGDSAIRLLSR
jgi:hypothetical protein